MKLLVAIAVLSTICASQATAGIFPPLARKSLPISPTGIDAAAICNGTYGNKCGDCFTLLVCVGHNKPFENKCPPDAPYCDMNICVAEKPTACSECVGPCPEPKQFYCTETEGFFPHPSNCNQYFECYYNKVIKYDCPPGYSWDTDGMGCKQMKVATDCGKITCKTTDYAAPLSNNATFFGFCNIQGGLEPIDGVVVAKCPSNLEKYDIVKRVCVFQCPAEGLYQHQQKPTFYYECYKSGSQILFEYKECSDGREFSDAEQRCIAPAGGGTSGFSNV